MRSFKKVMAFVMAAAMMVTAVPAAANTLPSGEFKDADSYLEGLAPEELIVDAVLPTLQKTDYEFVLDPQKLLNQFDNSNYAAETLIFKAKASGEAKASNYSKPAVMTNKGMGDLLLDVTITVSNVATNPVNFVSGASFASGNANTDVYLALVPGELGTVAHADLASGAAPGNKVPAQAVAVMSDGTASGSASATFLVAGKEDNYVLKQVSGSSKSGHSYEYSMVSGGAVQPWNTASFYMTGACNPYGDWKAFNEKSQADSENLKTSIVWSITRLTDDQAKQIEDGTVSGNATTGLIKFADPTPVDVAPSVEDVTYSKSGEIVIPYSLGTGALKANELTDIVFVVNGNKYSKNGTWNSNVNQKDNIVIEDGKVTLTTTLAEYMGTIDVDKYSVFMIFDNDVENYLTATVTLE